jgi:hypothetical protein
MHPGRPPLGRVRDSEEANQSWDSYLSGEYFVCLTHATPANMDGSCRTSSNCCDHLGRTMRPGEPS